MQYLHGKYLVADCKPKSQNWNPRELYETWSLRRIKKVNCVVIDAYCVTTKIFRAHARTILYANDGARNSEV